MEHGIDNTSQRFSGPDFLPGMPIPGWIDRFLNGGGMAVIDTITVRN